MKKINSLQLFFLITLLLISTKVISQKNSNLIKINPEISKKIIEEKNIDFTAYSVSFKEVDFPIYEVGDVPSKKYKKELEELEKLKKAGFEKGSYENMVYNGQLSTVNSLPKTENGLVNSGKTKKKQVYIVKDTLSITYDKIEGYFSILEDEYHIVFTEMPNEFIKYQVINTNECKYNTKLFSKPYNLIKKENSDEYFFIMDNEFLPILAQEQKNNEIFEIIHKLGYKEYKDEYGNYFIKSKTCEIKLDNWTTSELKSNPSYITALDNDQIKISALVKQTIPHSKILDKYLSVYNIKKNKMPSAEINSWRIATANAQKLHNQIYKLSEKYSGNYSFTLLDKSSTQDIFSENLLASKGVLGM